MSSPSKLGLSARDGEMLYYAIKSLEPKVKVCPWYYCRLLSLWYRISCFWACKASVWPQFNTSCNATLYISHSDVQDSQDFLCFLIAALSWIYCVHEIALHASLIYQLTRLIIVRLGQSGYGHGFQEPLSCLDAILSSHEKVRIDWKQQFGWFLGYRYS